jgi:hypothetical protein
MLRHIPVVRHIRARILVRRTLTAAMSTYYVPADSHQDELAFTRYNASFDALARMTKWELVTILEEVIDRLEEFDDPGSYAAKHAWEQVVS